jgi:D-glucuronyl C5-epimerase C-terminus
MMFAVLGIYGYYEYINDSNAKYLFDQGVIALKKNMARYDYKNAYSYYDILGNLSPLHYHNILIELSERLYDVTKEEIFKLYHE